MTSFSPTVTPSPSLKHACPNSPIITIWGKGKQYHFNYIPHFIIDRKHTGLSDNVRHFQHSVIHPYSVMADRVRTPIRSGALP